MAENGPRTQEVVADLRRLEDRFIDRGREIESRLVSLEGAMQTIERVVERSGVDLEAIKLSDKETKVTQRLILSVGGLVGTLIVSLIIFAATRG